ncbi:hypothetical protein BDV25DRAFT_158869 [Aspergillus avenaceus]|uniref:Uncharacterized protein n=1 Tax=Aspergillus avenaceus TaxID=36643 RepID=A0A5N6TP71_ASPAV|nr:hypothetical protein BDV25DRAFT_158869 [Aspergillus avenaceus]
MNPWQRNVRMIHQVSEVLDLDSAKWDKISDFIALIEAMREGVTQIDEDSRIPDYQINILFLKELKSRPEWDPWATDMLRSRRLDSPAPAEKLSFRDLAELAIEQEKLTLGMLKSTHHARSESTPLASHNAPPNFHKPSQEEINAFVIQQMKCDGDNSHRNHAYKTHRRRPSQEEINEYVIQQMYREQDHKTRTRSHSQPESKVHSSHQRAKTTSCTFCLDPNHQANNCWRRFRVALEAPHGNYLPKRVEYRTEIPGQPPMYRSGFTLF